MVKDFIIIGGGPAGNAAAIVAASHGKSVLLIERESLGGTCTNRGCIPTKFLLSRSAHLSDGPDGIQEGAWERLLNHKNGLVRGLSRSIEKSHRGAGIDVLGGSGRLEGANRVAVTLADGSRSVHEARTIILAAGSAPAELPGVSLDESDVISSTGALSLDHLPRSLAIVGSGAVGAEFAFIFNRFGVNTTLLEAAERLFPGEDPEVGSLFHGIYKRLGVDVRVGDPVIGIERGGGRISLNLSSGGVVETEKVLLGTGRRLLSADLGCEEAGVAIGHHGAVIVDGDQRSSIPTIFAAGDLTGRMLLAHVASREGEHAVRRALGLESRPIQYQSIPWAIFTHPEIGSVGAGAHVAAKNGIDAVVGTAPLMGNIKARIDRTTDGFVRVIAEQRTGKIIGGTVVGPQASDIVHVLGLAIHQGMSLADLGDFVFSHPGLAESIQEAVSDAYKQIILDT